MGIKEYRSQLINLIVKKRKHLEESERERLDSTHTEHIEEEFWREYKRYLSEELGFRSPEELGYSNMRFVEILDASA